MKYVMATMVLALAACGGPKNRPPPSEPVSTTQTTSAALTVYESAASGSGDGIVAAKQSDRTLATKVKAHLGRDAALKDVRWQDRVTLEVEDQHVTLRGGVPTIADSSEIERAVREVKGVKAVTNDLKSDDAYQH
jgi:osmotically-inducible protein OsmY